MTFRQAPDIAVRRRFGTAALLAVAVSLPAVASAGVSAYCDEAGLEPLVLVVPAEELSVSVVDHDTLSPEIDVAAPAAESLDELIRSRLTTPPADSHADQALRNVAPVADTATPEAEKLPEESIDEVSDSRNESRWERYLRLQRESSSSDDASDLRLRDRMYRTDI